MVGGQAGGSQGCPRQENGAAIHIRDERAPHELGTGENCHFLSLFTVPMGPQELKAPPRPACLSLGCPACLSWPVLLKYKTKLRAGGTGCTQSPSCCGVDSRSPQTLGFSLLRGKKE